MVLASYRQFDAYNVFNGKLWRSYGSSYGHRSSFNYNEYEAVMINLGYKIQQDSQTGLWVLYKDLSVVRWFKDEDEAKEFLLRILNIANSKAEYEKSNNG